MAKKSKTKQTTKKEKSPGSIISGILKEQEIDVPKKAIKHLVAFSEKYGSEPEETAKIFVKKFRSAKGRKPVSTALVRTRRDMMSSDFKSSSSYLGCIVGVSPKINDLSGDRLKEAQAKYNRDLKKLSGEEIDEQFITREEYEKAFKEMSQSLRDAEKIDDSKESYQKAMEAREMFEIEMDGRHIIEEKVVDKRGNPVMDEDGYQKIRLHFIDDMMKWPKSGSINFDFGKILRSVPQQQFASILFDDEQPRFVVTNVKYKERLDILSEAPVRRPVNLRIVDNEDNKWYVDNKFAIEEVETDEFGENQDEIDRNLIAYLQGCFPEKNQVSVDDINEWEKKMTDNTGKTNHLAFVNGYVDSLSWRDDGSIIMILVPEEEEFDLEMELDDDDDFSYLDDLDTTELRLYIDAKNADQIDFAEDSVVHTIVEVYRGDYYDEDTNQYDSTKKAEMPGGSVWGVIADPDQKTELDRPAVSAEDFDTEFDEEELYEDDEEDDLDYIDDEE